MIEFGDLLTIGFLVFLEGVLSIDNAVVLALLAKRLPRQLQRKALTYGIVGAVVFRLIVLAFAMQLMQWNWVKFVGGGYLIYVGAAHFLRQTSRAAVSSSGSQVAVNFWKTVVIIELTDIAFALDSILAAVAVSNKFWVVFSGGVIGLIILRFAATFFIRLLDRFPAFEETAYSLVLLIGIKLVVDGFHFKGIDFHSGGSPAFWIFWGLVAVTLLFGFRKKGKSKTRETIAGLGTEENIFNLDQKQ